MMLITWSERLSVGHPVLDDEHRALVGIINDLHEVVLAGCGRDAEGRALQRLVRHTRAHFAHEEELMRVARYPVATAHRLEHEHLLRVVARFAERFDNGCPLSTGELLALLTAWLEGHLTTADAELGRYLTSVRAAA
jgi:hemerythrin